VKKFALWMINNEKKQNAVAKKLKICQSTLHEIIKKDQLPNLVHARLIQNYTNDAVTMDDWLDELPEEKKIEYGLIDQLPQKAIHIAKDKPTHKEQKTKK
jgi:DNA-binding transcriptional regulator LsrR (DeoR family)